MSNIVNLKITQLTTVNYVFCKVENITTRDDMGQEKKNTYIKKYGFSAFETTSNLNNHLQNIASD